MVSQNSNKEMNKKALPNKADFELRNKEQYNTQMQQRVASNNKMSNASGGLSEKEKYNNLQQSRIKDQKTAMKATASKSIGKKSSMIGRRGAIKRGKPTISKDMAYASATAYKEVNLSEDAAHIIALVVSLGADIGTLVPVLNWVVTPLAILTLWVVYLLGGHWQKRIGRKAVISGCSYAAELFPIVSALPMFTIAAVLNYQMALVEKRLAKMQKNQI